jgi:acetolactate synthase-like protein
MTRSSPTGGERLATALVRHDVRALFTLAGGHISPIVVAAKQQGIRVVDVRHEANAVFAADATARLTGNIGVAAVTAGPGLTNALTPLRNALMARSPVLLLCGATATVLRGRGSLQDIDQMAAVRSHVKWAAQVDRADDQLPLFERAVATALSGVRGPVALECPVDLLYDEALVREMYGVTKALDGSAPFGKRVERWYLERHLRKTLGGDRSADPAAAAERTAPRPARGAPSASAVVRARAALDRAERPVLLVGSQAMDAPQDAEALATAIRALGVPTYLAGMARGLLGADDPLQYRHKRREALRAADCVILAGTPMDFRLDYGRHIAHGATLITANADPLELRKNRRPTMGIAGEADLFLRALVSGAPQPAWDDWHRAMRAREDERDAEIEARAADAVQPVNPIALCRAIDALLTDDATIVADGGDFVATAAYVLRPRAPLSWLDPGVFGTLGVGAGFAMGARVLRPEGVVWLLYGDGAAGFSLMEFSTLVRHGLPVIAVVGNDGAWTQIMRDQVPMLGDDVATVLGREDYERVVEGLGARGFRIERPEAVEGTLQEALAVARGGTPVLVNVHIGLTEFRKGAISL